MKLNYKRDAVLGLIGAVILFASSVYSFNSDMQNKGILLVCLGAVMLIFGIFCLIKIYLSKQNNDKK